jgi:hypothetical protein
VQDLPAKTATTARSHATPTLPIEDDDQEIWFRYYAEDQSADAHVHIRFNTWTERLNLALEGEQDRLRITKRVSGTWTTIAQRDDYPTEVGTWYNVYIRASGSYVGVWRGKVGEPLEFVFEAYDAPAMDNDSFAFATEPDGTYRFDNLRIKSHNNLGDFLHLKSDSPAIDAGDTDLINGEPVVFRDFDDQFGPVDGDQDFPDFFIDRDMGADEFPTNGGFTYWWRNF